MGLKNTLYYALRGKKISSKTGEDRVRASKLEAKICKLSDVYVEMGAYQQIKNLDESDTRIIKLEETSFGPVRGIVAYFRIRDFVSEKDDFDWMYTYMEYTQRRIKKKKLDLLDIMIMGNEVIFNIQVEGKVKLS